MSETSDIRNAARNWIERYDKDALAQLAQRLSELEEHKEQEAHALWLKIRDEVRMLLDIGTKP